MTSTVPQDITLPDEVVLHAARLAFADMMQIADEDGGRTGRATFGSGTLDIGNLEIQGRVDMLRLVRVVSAALKEGGS